MFWKGLPTQVRIICFITNLENKFNKFIGWIIYYYLQPQFSSLFPGVFFWLYVFLQDIQKDLFTKQVRLQEIRGLKEELEVNDSLD